MHHLQNFKKLKGTLHPKNRSPTQPIHELTDRSQTASPSTFFTAQSPPVSPFSPPPIQHISFPAPPSGRRTRYSELPETEDLRELQISLQEIEAAGMPIQLPLPSSPSYQQSPEPQRMMQSPSGLSAAEYQVRQDRVLSIAERKEAIREGTQREIAMQPAVERREEQDEQGGLKSAFWEVLRTYTCCGRGREREREGGKGWGH